MAREGRDVSVITYAAMVYVALEAAEILAKEGIELEVVDLRTVLPLDRDAIRQTVEKTNRVIVLHEDTKTGGIAGEVAAIINEECFDSLDAPIVRIASADSPVPFSPPLEGGLSPQGGRRGAGSAALAEVLRAISPQRHSRTQRRKFDNHTEARRSRRKNSEILTSVPSVSA